MGDIYRGSAVTLCAMTSTGSRDGILKKASQPIPTPIYLRVFPDRDDVATVSVSRRKSNENTFRNLYYTSAWSQRGWTFQENALSLRSLFFDDRQIYWKCPTHFRSLDGLPSGDALFPYLSHLKPLAPVLQPSIPRKTDLADINEIKSGYYQLVRDYSDRVFTYDSDKLPAFAGLAQRFLPVFSGEYLAGLWSSDFARGLVWRASSGLRCHHVRPYRAPSWSWAAINGAMMYSTVGGDWKDLLSLISWDIRPVSGFNPFGEVSGGHATVRGPTKPFLRGWQVTHGEKPHVQMGIAIFDDPVSSEFNRRPLTSVPIYTIDSYTMCPLPYPRRQEIWARGSAAHGPYEYLALAVGSSDGIIHPHIHGLILRAPGGAFEDGAERVGYWVIFPSEKQERWTDRTLKLI